MSKQSILLAENGKEYIRKACTPGVAVSHCIWGTGRIESVKGDTVKIIFDSGIEKAINPYMLAARGDFVVQKDGFLDELEEYKESIINESLIESTIIDAERKLGPIIEFLD